MRVCAAASLWLSALQAIASQMYDDMGPIKILSVETGLCVQTLKGHEDRVHTICFGGRVYQPPTHTHPHTQKKLTYLRTRTFSFCLYLAYLYMTIPVLSMHQLTPCACLLSTVCCLGLGLVHEQRMPDAGSHLVSSCVAGYVKVWHLATSQLLHTYKYTHDKCNATAFYLTAEVTPKSLARILSAVASSAGLVLWHS